MAAPRNTAAPAAIALAAGTAKTVLNLVAGANDPIGGLVEIAVSVDLATIVTVELCESSQGGTGTSTDFTASIKQTGNFLAGDSTAPAQVTVRSNYSAEPTTLTVLKQYQFSGPGPFVMQYPLGREPQSLLSGSTKYKALALRVTAVAACNARPHMEWE